MIKVNYPTITLNKPFEYKSSSYGSKRKNKLWINSYYSKDEDNYYNVSVLITKENNNKIEFITGRISNKDFDINITQEERKSIINKAYQYAKENNYLWKES